MRTTNRAGRTYTLMVLTPIQPGLEGELRAYLEALPADASPLARLGRTHMARWIVVSQLPVAPGGGGEDPLGESYLLFTSTFDGALDSYLHELVEHMAEAAAEIWGRCTGCPQPAAGAALKAYIGRNQIDCGVVFAAYGASVEQVHAALRKRERLIDFAIRAQDMQPADRRTSFLREFGP